MAETPETPEVSVSAVSSKSVVTLAGAFITALGAVAVAYYANRPDDADRFYGWEGRTLQQQSTEHATRIAELYGMVADIQHEIARIDANDLRCEQRQDKNEEIVLILRDKVHDFQSARKSIDQHQTKMIDICIRRLGL